MSGNITSHNAEKLGRVRFFGVFCASWLLSLDFFMAVHETTLHFRGRDVEKNSRCDSRALILNL